MYSKLVGISLSLCWFTISFAQGKYEFEPSQDFPFGLPHPEAPSQLLDFAPLIGESTCESVSRNANQEWGEPVMMTWRFKYIMNGMAVQDETLKEDGRHSGSIRQYIPDSNRWFVHYYSSAGPSTILPAWEGNKREDGNIVLYRDQQAPNGMEGDYRLTFYDISEDRFKWIGEWVTKDESITFPTWRIDCQRTKQKDRSNDRKIILENIKAFSAAYMRGDAEAMAQSYTPDGKIFPGRAKVLEGYDSLLRYWTLGDGVKILKHDISPEEITFVGDAAYDYGYYEGSTQRADGSIAEWKGKYLIIWKKIDGNWKMYLDIWNRVD